MGQMSITNFLRRHGRSLMRERICPFYFHVRGGRLYDPENPIDGVQSVVSGRAERRSCAALEDPLFGTRYSELIVDYPVSYIHRIDACMNELSILPSGGLRLGKRSVLSAGVHPYAAMWEALARSSVSSYRHEELIVLPWAHSWYTFGDFMDTIYPQIASVFQMLSVSERRAAVIALPGLATRPWVADYCALLGVDSEQLIDLEVERVSSTRNGVVVTTSGLAHYSSTAHPAHFQFFRDRNRGEPLGTAGLKLYLQRQHGRCLTGEAELLCELKRAGYQVVSGGLTALEQADLFAQATHVVGPHGGAFGNIVFSSNCRVFEFQHPRWMCPCFRQIAQILDHSYMLTVDPVHKPSFGIVHGYAQNNLQLPVAQLLEAILKS